MSDDIVTRLRRDVSGVEYMPHVTDPQGMIVLDAADEIERLREQNEYLKANVEQLVHEAVRGEK